MTTATIQTAHILELMGKQPKKQSKELQNKLNQVYKKPKK